MKPVTIEVNVGTTNYSAVIIVFSKRHNGI